MLLAVIALLSGLLSWPGGMANPAHAGAVVTNSGNFTLQLTASPNPAQQGDTITWTVTVKNIRTSGRTTLHYRPNAIWSTQTEPVVSGAIGCTPTMVVETGGWQVRAGWPNWWSLAPNAVGRFTCTTTAPAPGSYLSNVSFNARFGTADGRTVDTGWTPPSTANETLTVAPPPVADLTVSKSASASTVPSGTDVTYTVEVGNIGSGSANRYTLTDQIPANFTNIRVTSPATGCSVNTATNTVTCANQTVPTGAAKNTYTIVARATSPGATSNVARVSQLPEETAIGNNTSGAANVTIQAADLTVTKTATPNPIVAGQPVTFTITVKNTGNAASSTYTLTDVVPSQFTGVQFSGTQPSGCSITGNTVSCTNQGGLAATTGTRTYTLTAVASTAMGSPFTNNATLSATSNENTANNSGSVSVTVQPAESDLTVTKSASKTSGVVRGETVTYTVTVRNSGNTTSSTYTLTDAVPSAFTAVAVTAVNPASTACAVSSTNNTVTCTNQAGLAPNGTRAYTITAVANSNAATTTTNTAIVSATSGEASTTNNSGSVNVAIIDNAPDLVVTKTASAAQVAINQQVNYTVTVRNTGNVASGPYTLSDVVPDGFTLATTPTVGCALDDPTRTVNCPNRPSLAPNETATYTFTMTAGQTPMNTNNRAFVATVPGEVVTNNNEAYAAVEIITTSPYDLVVSKGASTGLVQTGDTVQFTIVVTNNGSGPSGVWSLTDAVPSNFSSVEYVGTRPDECWISGNTLSCTNMPGLAASASASFTIRAVANTAGSVVNTATATTPGETNTTNNSATAPVTIQEAGGPVISTMNSDGNAFTLTKSANPTGPLPVGGGPVTYTYTVKNNTTRPIYLVSGTDDKCRINASSATNLRSYDIYGPWGVAVRDRWLGVAPGETAAWSCTETVRITTTNTATFRFATSYDHDFWGTPYRTGVQTATVQARVTVTYDPWAACSITTFWGNTGNWGATGQAALYEYTAAPDGTVTKTGKTISANASGVDIAISPDGTKMYILSGSGKIQEYDVATGTRIRIITVTFPDGTRWNDSGGTNTTPNLNSLSFGADGRLYFGGANFSNETGDSSALYAITPTTGTTNYSVAATTVVSHANGPRYGFKGDFVTLPNGDLLASVCINDCNGSGFGIYPKQADGSYGPFQYLGEVQTTGGSSVSGAYGMTYSNGFLWLAVSGSWYRYDTLPAIGDGKTNYRPSAVLTGDLPSGTFWGATGAQESNTSCTSPTVTITKDPATTNQVTGPGADGQYTANYVITVKNTGTAAGTYAPLTDMPQFDRVFTATGANWTGQATGSATGSGPYAITTIGTSIAAGATHTYNVSIHFTWDKTALPQLCTGPGTGLFNNVQAHPASNDDTCINPPLPWLNVNKAPGVATGPDSQGVYAVTYTVTVRNSGSGATTYGPLSDQPQFDGDLTVQSASWTGQSTGGPVAGTGPFALAPAGTGIAANTTHTFNLTVRYKVTGTGEISVCQNNTSGNGLANTALLPGENGSAIDNSACVEHPLPKLFDVVLQKVNIDGQPLTGATFNLYGPDSIMTEIPGPWTVGDDGKVTFTQLAIGTYRVVEDVAPKGYALDPREYAFIVVPGGAVTLHPDNPANPSLGLSTTTGVQLDFQNLGELEYPATGGIGSFPFAVMGLLLMALGIHRFRHVGADMN